MKAEIAESIKEETEVKGDEEETKDEAPEDTREMTQDEIMILFDECKAKDPKMTFKDFCLKVATGEIGLYLEEASNEKK